MLLCCFVLFLLLVFSFNHPISSSICELPIRREIYKCTFKKTNKDSIIIIFMIIISISIIVYQPPKYDAIRNIKSTNKRYADSADGSDFFSEHFLVLLSIIVVFLFSNFFLQL